MENVRRHIPFFSRRRWGVKNRAPWSSIIQHTIHQFHENDLFTPAAAMSYFGLLTLFPALLVMLVISNRFAAGSEALARMVEVYPGSREFLRATVRSLKDVGWGGLATATVVTFWAGSWVFAVIERALNRIWGTRPRAFLHGRALTLSMIGAVGAGGPVLTWSYMSSLILMFGAQLSVVLHQEHAGAELAAETPASPS